jgi:hypoxanthine phosphoribosyltransferase
MNFETANNVLGQAELLINDIDVAVAITRIANEITERLAYTNPVVLCVMNGGLIFSGQLLTKLKFPLEFDYVHATRYGHNVSGSKLHWIVKPQINLSGRTVILLDDILDEGITLTEIACYCRQQGAQDVLMAVLVEKLHQRKVISGMRADFTGIEVGDRFLFGYGLDYQGYWRNAPGIYAVKKL